MGVVSAIHTPRLMKEGLSPCFLNEREEWVVNRKEELSEGHGRRVAMLVKAFHLGTHTFVHFCLFPARHAGALTLTGLAALAIWGKGPR